MLGRDQTHPGREASVHRTYSIQPQAAGAPPGPGLLSPVPVSSQPIRKASSKLRLTRLRAFAVSILVLSSWKTSKPSSAPFSSLHFPTWGVQEAGKWEAGVACGQVLDTEWDLESKQHRAEPGGRMKGLSAWSPPFTQPRTSSSPPPIRPSHPLTHPLSHQSSQPPPSNMDTHPPTSPFILPPAQPAPQHKCHLSTNQTDSSPFTSSL